jgi:2-oxoglutarate ferredoxin oxidoreductase subunit beta
MHVRQVKQDILLAFQKPGFSFLEILSPCPVGYGKSNALEEGLDEMLLYKERCVMGEGIPLDELGIDLREERPIYIGRFINRDLPAFQPVLVEDPE